MWKTLLAAIAAVFSWFIVVTLLNLACRRLWQDYALAEAAMQFSLAMLWTRLAMGAAASLAAGAVAGRLARKHGYKIAAGFAGGVLLAIFIPVHYGLWAVFPFWYHVLFLASLLPLSLLGANWKKPRITPVSVANAVENQV